MAEAVEATWAVFYTGDVGLSGKADEEVFAWAQQQSAVVVTFDEDFADGRSFPAQQHHGIVRLRVWPTAIEETEQAGRLLSKVTEAELTTSRIIVDRSRIRVRTRPEYVARPANHGACNVPKSVTVETAFGGGRHYSTG